MIATELYEGQGLGNQLWVYVVSRSIAEQLGVGFLLQGVERFKGRQFLEIDPLVNVGAEDCQQCSFRSYYETMFYDGDLKCISSGFDQAVTQIQDNVKLEGLFQSERYLFGDMGRLRRYLRLKPEWRDSVPMAEDTCVINLRGGEYKRHKNLILPMSYWTNAIRNMKERTGVEKFLVVTDDVKYAKVMFPRYEVLTKGIGECYSAIYNAKHLILSNSSFAYFPAKTGNSKQCVIAPMHWARFGNELGRWASPANLYGAWLWQDKGGGLHTYEDCVPSVEATERHYQTYFYMRSTPDQIINKSLRRFIPSSIRKQAKRVLSMAFPKQIG